MNKEVESFYADECIKNAIASNDDGMSLFYALSGMGMYRLGSDRYHNFVESIDALYRFISLNPDQNISREINNAFNYLVTDLGMLSSVYVALGTLKYQNKNQIDQISPFIIDIQKHMDLLLASIKSDEDLKDNPQVYEMYDEVSKLIKEDSERVKQ